ncbi:MAG: ATP-binding cassette domain-containing protein [Magnetococcales bacterium]|nr:ATP-binding cassette domain-containing protein [Magnetococcales bacterium]
MDPVLLLENLAWDGVMHHSGAPLLRAVTWGIAAGERWAVVGPEGCGKSTLLRLMAGLLVPTQGAVWLNGQPCASVVNRAAAMGVLFGDPAARFLTPVVWEEVALTPSYYGLAGDLLQQRVVEALQRVGLSAAWGRRELASLSAAQAARVALAAVLVMRPPLLLWDEPGAQLSESGELALAQQLRDMTSVVFTSRMARAKLFADRLVWLEEGELRFL